MKRHVSGIYYTTCGCKRTIFRMLYHIWHQSFQLCFGQVPHCAKVITCKHWPSFTGSKHCFRFEWVTHLENDVIFLLSHDWIFQVVQMEPMFNTKSVGPIYNVKREMFTCMKISRVPATHKIFLHANIFLPIGLSWDLLYLRKFYATKMGFFLNCESLHATKISCFTVVTFVSWGWGILCYQVLLMYKISVLDLTVNQFVLSGFLC